MSNPYSYGNQNANSGEGSQDPMEDISELISEPRPRVKWRLSCGLYGSRRRGQITVFLITFLSYVGFHSTRKAFSNVKANIADPRCVKANNVFGDDKTGYFCCKNGVFTGASLSHLFSGSTVNTTASCGATGSICKLVNVTGPGVLNISHSTNGADLPTCDAWFGDVNTTTHYLGLCDTLFLFFYAIGLYISGFIEDRVNLRYALSAGMLISGAAVFLFAFLGSINVRSFYPYAAVWAINGLVQSSGWPGNVAVMGNWFGSIRLCGLRIERGAVIGAVMDLFLRSLVIMHFFLTYIYFFLGALFISIFLSYFSVVL